MPIKFRCSYCRQFLGISRNRAGELFDCPTCGRTIRVPSLDGTVAPVPEPELNAADAHLARALDELAALADPNAVPKAAVAVDVAEAEAEIPQPLPEPEPLELPLPAVVTPVVPPGLAPSAVQEPEIAVSLADLLPLAATTSTAAVSPTSTQGVMLSRGWLAAVLAAPTVALFAGVALGWLVGSRSPAATTSAASADVPAVVAATEGVTLTGRISFRNDAGETKPDVGAVVILWPEDWEGATRLPPFGLRPADSDADQVAAAATVAGMGGGLARAAADGSYELRVSEPGRYRRLVISRLKARPGDEPLSAALLDELKQYLSDPAATLGERAFTWQPQTLEATGNPAVDHVF